MNPAANQLALYESGSRIRAIVGETPGGAKMWMGWYDTEFEKRCYLACGRSMGICYGGPSEDRWCVMGEWKMGSFWADSNCTVPLSYRDEPTSDYIIVFDDTSRKPAIHARGAEYRGTVYAEDPCEEVEPVGRLWRIGDELSPGPAKFTSRVE